MSEQLKTGHAERRANSEKRAGKGYRQLSRVSVLLILAVVVGGYFYLTRAQDTVVLKVGSGPFRSDSHELMKEVADVVSRHSNRLVIEVVPTRDSSHNISLLNDGVVDAATIRSDTPVVNDVRQVANLFPDYFQIITRADRPVFRINDLDGRRVAIPRFGTDEFRSFWIVGDHYDLPINGVKWLAMRFEDATRKLLAGEVDALFTVRSLRDRLLLNLFEDAELKQLKLRFVALDQAEAIAIKRPFLQVGEVPKGAFVGKEPTPRAMMTTATVDRVLVTREGQDPAIIRELTRILFEHRLDLTIRFALASAIKRPDTNAGLGIPLHEGAEQYFNRDEPTFIQENAEPLALLVTLTAMLVSSFFAIRSRFIKSQKNRMDSYNYVLLDIADAARKSSDKSELRGLKNQLSTVLEDAVKALDKDAVTDEGFQSFSLLWESVREILNDRMNEITSD
ncbi:MAG: TAXI family TRAP transporter solute-binding subunit [Pseudomonadota bacterium]